MVYHLSNSSISWVVEMIENGFASCSLIIKEPYQHKKEIFPITSIKKILKSGPTFISSPKRNNSW